MKTTPISLLYSGLAEICHDTVLRSIAHVLTVNRAARVPRASTHFRSVFAPPSPVKSGGGGGRAGWGGGGGWGGWVGVLWGGGGQQ